MCGRVPLPIQTRCLLLRFAFHPKSVCACVPPPKYQGRSNSNKGRGGDVEELRPTRPSSTSQENVPALCPPWAPVWAAGGHYSSSFSFHLISRCVIPLRLTQQGQKLTPYGSFHLVLYAILDVWHTWHLNSIPSSFSSSSSSTSSDLIGTRVPWLYITF